MTPEDLDLITSTSAAITADPDAFSADFYQTVFEIAPAARALFPDDLAEQQRKLGRELALLVEAAAAAGDPERLEALLSRLRRLGARHVAYGVTPTMYEPVGAALLATLRKRAPGYGDEHETAWTKLYVLVSETMLEGAAAAAQTA